MPSTKFLAFVFEDDSEIILKEAGPEIFVQSYSLIVPSGSLDAEPSNEMLSVGKAITWFRPCCCDRRFVIFFAAFAGCFFFAGYTNSSRYDGWYQMRKEYFFHKYGLVILMAHHNHTTRPT